MARRRKKPVGVRGDQGAIEEDEKRRKEIRDKIDVALQESSLSLVIQSKYRKTLVAVVDAMKPNALALFSSHVKVYRFYKTHAELTEALQSKYRAIQVRGILKGCFDRNGALHLDGGGHLFGRRANLSEFYAHEITHAIDGTTHDISDSETWRSAWEAERHYLSENGKSKPSEGFAEFGEMLLGSGITRRQIKEVMPMCLKAWEEYKL